MKETEWDLHNMSELGSGTSDHMKPYVPNVTCTIEHALVLITFTFSHLADAFIQSDLQLGNTWSDSSWRDRQTEEVPITPSLRHCSNKYKLAREREKDKEKDYVFFSLGWSQVVLKEMSFQLLLEDWQGSSVLDGGGGGGIIPPARNGERECSGEWFWASLWWYHEVMLTSGSQTSEGDVRR